MRTRIGVMRIGRLLALGTSLAGLLLGTGCSSFSGGSENPGRQVARLRAGMDFAEVGRILGPEDPGLKEDLAEAVAQERQAQKERDQAAAILRDAGIGAEPKLRSNVTIDRGNYLLVFTDGKLISWSLR